MNQRLQKSATIDLNSVEWNIINNSLKINPRECTGKFSQHTLKSDISMKTKQFKVMKYIIRIQYNKDIKKIVKMFGINSIFYPRLKYPSVTDVH